MLRIVAGLLLLLLSVLPSPSSAQTIPSAIATAQMREEQDDFLWYLHYLSIDSNLAGRITRFAHEEVDSMHRVIMTDTKLPDEEKADAIRSIANFLRELSQKLSLSRLEIYDYTGAVEPFKLVLRALLHHRPVTGLLRSLGLRHSQLLAAAFWHYDECALLDDIALYRRVASSPAYILSFLEKHRGFRFADTLLLAAAAYDPLKLIAYLQHDMFGLRELVRNNKNIYLQQIVSLAYNRDAPDLIPFTVALAEKRITEEEILEKRTDVNGYFRLLVNTLKYDMSAGNAASLAFLAPLRKGIKEKSLAFYVNRINELHGAADELRFAPVKGLRMEDLYYIITSCTEELYTSSYIGLYRRLMEYFRDRSADTLFREMKYDHFRSFIHMAADYNMLADFLGCMPVETAADLLRRYTSEIEADPETSLEKAMDVADAISALSALPWFSEMIENELWDNLDRCHSARSYLGIRLYTILLQVYSLINHKDAGSKLWTYLGNYELLEHDSLVNENGRIVELVLFYGDEDGLASFKNFLGLFKDTTKWSMLQNERWVTIRSRTPTPIFVYANLPLDYKSEMDLQAQDSLYAFLLAQSDEPAVLIHRGHSYHLDFTLKRLKPSVRLAILGSCGGHNSILSIANISPGAQIIVSKRTGSMLVNDPLIDVINKTLQDDQDLAWTKVWEELAFRFRKDQLLLSLFNEYIPPRKNVSLFVLKLFNY